MALTIYDVADLLRRQDCLTILELLDITEDELVDRFLDKLEDRIETLEGTLNE
jgi:hypothetical protein